MERLLGVINYVGKFIPDMSTIIHPIRELLQKEVQFTWQWEQIKAFQRVKERLSTAPALAFFNGTKPIVVSCDASQHGLGAVLHVLQEGRPIAYASRALTSAETRYAQIEKELLADVYALERFHQYTYGSTVEVESDHKPLETISIRPRLLLLRPHLLLFRGLHQLLLTHPLQASLDKIIAE